VQQELGSLAARLARLLPAKELGHPTVLSVLAALSSIGRVAPEAFQQHAKAVAEFVVGRYCKAPLKAQRAGVSEARLKGAAFKSLARALVPDSVALQPPAACVAAAERLVAALAPLLDLDLEETGMLQVGAQERQAPAAAAAAAASAAAAPPRASVVRRAPMAARTADTCPQPPLSQPPCQDEADEAQRSELRLAAASAVLRLARRHDRRLPAELYVAACLTVQDPNAEVRRAFGAKLGSLLQHLAQRPASRHLAAKFAAALALCAMDPVEHHRELGRKVGCGGGLAGWLVGARRGGAGRWPLGIGGLRWHCGGEGRTRAVVLLAGRPLALLPRPPPASQLAALRLGHAAAGAVLRAAAR
jgi:hypothetical protein